MDGKKEPWWKRELREIFAISFTFYVLFVLFSVMKMAMLEQHDIHYFKAGAALIGSLILGKVVLIFDKLPIVKKMDFMPNIYRVFLRSMIYLVGYVLFSILEHLIKELIDGISFTKSLANAFHHLETKGFLLSLVSVFIVFLFFNAFWVIRHHLGPKMLYQMFFKK